MLVWTLDADGSGREVWDGSARLEPLPGQDKITRGQWASKKLHDGELSKRIRQPGYVHTMTLAEAERAANEWHARHPGFKSSVERKWEDRAKHPTRAQLKAERKAKREREQR